MKMRNEKTESKKESGLQIRMVIAALFFLLYFALNQMPATKSFLASIQLTKHIASFEEIYRLEDACIVWYNSVTDEK